MSPRKAILQELDQAHRAGREGTRPSSIRGFSENASKYQSAVNDLLKAQLINGQKDSEGHLAIAINPHREGDVQKELRPMLARPVVWAPLLLATAVASFAVLF
jgi:hypothetical protein